jgi:hypothetical protein
VKRFRTAFATHLAVLLRIVSPTVCGDGRHAPTARKRWFKHEQPNYQHLKTLLFKFDTTKRNEDGSQKAKEKRSAHNNPRQIKNRTATTKTNTNPTLPSTLTPTLAVALLTLQVRRSRLCGIWKRLR